MTRCGFAKFGNSKAELDYLWISALYRADPLVHMIRLYPLVSPETSFSNVLQVYSRMKRKVRTLTAADHSNINL